MMTRKESSNWPCPETGSIGEHAEKCLGNLCPKWQDSKRDELWCRYNLFIGLIDESLCPHGFKFLNGSGRESLRIVNPYACNLCHERYGYCGG